MSRCGRGDALTSLLESLSVDDEQLTSHHVAVLFPVVADHVSILCRKAQVLDQSHEGHAFGELAGFGLDGEADGHRRLNIGWGFFSGSFSRSFRSLKLLPPTGKPESLSNVSPFSIRWMASSTA